MEGGIHEFDGCSAFFSHLFLCTGVISGALLFLAGAAVMASVGLLYTTRLDACMSAQEEDRVSCCSPGWIGTPDFVGREHPGYRRNIPPLGSSHSYCL
jgi:hypothetical protein